MHREAAQVLTAGLSLHAALREPPLSLISLPPSTANGSASEHSTRSWLTAAKTAHKNTTSRNILRQDNIMCTMHVKRLLRPAPHQKACARQAHAEVHFGKAHPSTTCGLGGARQQNTPKEEQKNHRPGSMPTPAAEAPTNAALSTTAIFMLGRSRIKRQAGVIKKEIWNS